MFTPQKFLNKSALPPKPSTPKLGQKQNFSFENLQNTPISYNCSPRNSTPVRNKTIESSSKTPLKTNNSSPSHRRSLDILTHNSSEESKKFHEHIMKIEAEKDKLKLEMDHMCNTVADLEARLCSNGVKLRKKDEKIRFLALLLKETEVQFKNVLESSSKDLEKIIQEQAHKIKELNDALKNQQKDLSVKWESEKQELASQINLLEQLNLERLKNQAESFTEKIAELSLSVEQLEVSNKCKETDLVDYFKRFESENDFNLLVCSLVQRVKNEVRHLQGIISGVCKEEDVSLSKILISPGYESVEKPAFSDLPKTLQHCLQGLSSIKTDISDAYAERYGETCKIQ